MNVSKFLNISFGRSQLFSEGLLKPESVLIKCVQNVFKELDKLVLSSTSKRPAEAMTAAESCPSPSPKKPKTPIEAPGRAVCRYLLWVLYNNLFIFLLLDTSRRGHISVKRTKDPPRL